MTEPNNEPLTDPNVGEPTAPPKPEPEKTYSQADMDRKFSEMTRRLKSFQDKDEAAAATKAKAEKDQALKKGELQKVIDTLELEKESWAKERSEIVQKHLSEKLDVKLSLAGISSEEERLGFGLKYFSLEGEDRPTVDEWIDKLKTDRPEKFTAQPKPMPTGAVGNVPQSGSTDSLEARLKHPDASVRREARFEQMKKTGEGVA